MGHEKLPLPNVGWTILFARRGKDQSSPVKTSPVIDRLSMELPLYELCMQYILPHPGTSEHEKRVEE